MTGATRFVTLHLAFPRGSAAAERAVEGLSPLLARWRPLGRRVTPWILWKPPGLRLRLRWKEDGRFWRPVLAGLRALRRARVIQGWFAAEYEPEYFQFGGVESWQAVNDYFCRDTYLWLDWRALRNAEGTAVTARALSFAAVDDLFSRAQQPGGARAVTLWRRLAELHRDPPLLRRATSTRPSPGPQLDAGARALLLRYRRANQALVSRLRALGRRLGSAVGQILPVVSLFHWNRFALDDADRARLLAWGTGA